MPRFVHKKEMIQILILNRIEDCVAANEVERASDWVRLLDKYLDTIEGRCEE